MYQSLARLIDKLFPPRLSVAGDDDFYRYRLNFTERQLRAALWLAFGAMAAYGLTDMFAGDGGIVSMRFRYLVACPVMALLAIIEPRIRWRVHRDTFVGIYSLCLAVILFWQLHIIDQEQVFRIPTGTPTINFFVALLFGYGLFPVFLIDGLFFGTAMIVAHTLLVATSHELAPQIWFSYVFNIIFGVCAGMFVAYWREWFTRSEYHNTLMLSLEKEQLKDALIGYVSLDALKRKHGEVVADAFGEVSVLFCDIAGFTVLSERVAPKHLIEILNRIFSAFDGIIERHGAEKVKTIGDAYMVVAGTKPSDGNHAHQLAAVALEMTVAVEDVARELGYPLQLRSGIHTGSLIGGIIGEKRPTYDYWGRTVNTASRLEHCSVPGRVQISEATYWRVKDAFDCEPRGEIEVRDIGRMTCYFLLGRKTASETPAI